MGRAPRGNPKTKRKSARASTSRLKRQDPSSGSVEQKTRAAQPSSADPSPRIIPVRTAMTPRPNLELPNISLENVDWEDTRTPLSPLDRWDTTERALAKRLRDLGADGATPRFEGKEARVVWTDGLGFALAEARAQIVASYLDPANMLVMAWADPVLAPFGIECVEGWGDSLAIDRATARELLLDVAGSSGAEYLMGLKSPQGEHYLALRSLKRTVPDALVTPGSPVGMVLRTLGDLRRSVSARDEPVDVLRARFTTLGKAMTSQSSEMYRETEWVGRLERTGRVLGHLGGRLAAPTFSAIAAGRVVEDTLDDSLMQDLIDAIKLMEDEWEAFA